MRLPLKSEFIPLVRAGAKRSTVRAGRRRIGPGPAEIVSGNVRIPIRITLVEHKPFGALTHADALADGFNSRDDLYKALHTFYPELSDNDAVSVIHFDLNDPNDGYVNEPGARTRHHCTRRIQDTGFPAGP
jgi:hypothetical protein